MLLGTRSGEGDDKSNEDKIIDSALGRFIKHRYARTMAACKYRSPLPTFRIEVKSQKQLIKQLIIGVFLFSVKSRILDNFLSIWAFFA